VPVALQQIDKIEGDLKTLGTEFEWVSLHHALQFIPTTAQHPYGAFSLVMETLQAAGLSAAWLMIQYRELWNLPGLIFVTALVAVTSWALWLNFQLNRYFRNYGAFQIAAMLQEIRRHPGKKSSAGAGN
jgi:hypothetical protein